MMAQSSEKIGIVVIHGVGETYEGWIDHHLVPELEKWAAFKSVDAIDRKALDNRLLLVARADDRHIAISLEDDRDFAHFCKVAGLEPLAEDPKFKTRDARLANRDDLRHYIASVSDLKKSGDWLHELRSAGVPCTYAFRPESAVHRVRDPISSDPATTWQAYARRCTLPDREIIVTELFWADMSRSGTTNMSRLYALIQLMLESPWVLGRAFLNGSDSGIHALIRRLILVSNWIMRWPIAGLNTAVFLTAFAAIAMKQLSYENMLAVTVGVSLLVIAIGGYRLFLKWVHRKIGLADLALSASLHAVILGGLLGLAVLAAPPEVMNRPETYLNAGILLILLAWVAWTVVNVLAIVLLSLVALKRVFIRKRPQDPPLARPAAAISLGVLLGMLWKFVLALLGLMVIVLLVPDSGKVIVACGTEQVDYSSQLSPTCLLALVKDKILSDVIWLNTLGLFLIFLAAGAIIGVRSAVRRIYRARVAAGTLILPRLIAHPLIVATIFLAAILNALLVLLIMHNKTQIGRTLAEFEPFGTIETAGAALIGMAVFFFVLRRVLDWSGSIIHIGRDLVDHQYDPDPRSLAMRLVPAAKQSKPRKYMRRQRIQKRLEALIDEVIASQNADNVVFLAHSQGTVILHDYLLDHDNLVGRTHSARKSLYDAKRIDVVTIGSPLTHIYRHYFQDYDQPLASGASTTPLIGRVGSWTNMWRVDDPIGQDVRLAASSMAIDNRGLGPGGHTYYWREDALCEKLWSLIGQQAPSPQPPGSAA